MKNNIEQLKLHLLNVGRDKSYNELAQEYQIVDRTGHISGEKVRGIWRRLKISKDPSSEKPLRRARVLCMLCLCLKIGEGWGMSWSTWRTGPGV